MIMMGKEKEKRRGWLKRKKNNCKKITMKKKLRKMSKLDKKVKEEGKENLKSGDKKEKKIT